MGQDPGERFDRRFAKLWAASSTSALGTGLATIATPLLVASRTSDPLIVAAASGAAWLPWLLFALPGGVLVDRVDRRRLMILIDWVRVVALGVLGTAIVTGRASVALLYVVLFVVNTGEIVMRTASQAMVPAVVPREGLERANGWLFGGAMLMNGMVAGPLSGLLFAVAASLPFFVNAGTYAASAVLFALIAGSYRPSGREVTAPAGSASPRPPKVPSPTTELVAGFRWLVHQPLVRTMAVLIGLLNVTLTAALAVTQPLSLVLLWPHSAPPAANVALPTASRPSPAPAEERWIPDSSHRASLWSVRHDLLASERQDGVVPPGAVTFVENGPPLRAFAPLPPSLLN